jgi:hypothetical protein
MIESAKSPASERKRFNQNLVESEFVQLTYAKNVPSSSDLEVTFWLLSSSDVVLAASVVGTTSSATFSAAFTM